MLYDLTVPSTKPETKKRGQKAITLGNPAKGDFESWCAANGYAPRTVMLAGWLYLQSISHESRMKHFSEADAKYPKRDRDYGDRDAEAGKEPATIAARRAKAAAAKRAREHAT